MARYFFYLFLGAGAAVASPALATDCCAGSPPAPPATATPAETFAGRQAAPLAAWMFVAPTATSRPKRASGRQFEYMFERHFWLMGGVRTLPAGLPLTPATSSADREVYSLAGLGLSYGLSPAVRATTNWTTGLGPYTVSPGSQFTVGLSLRR